MTCRSKKKVVEGKLFGFPAVWVDSAAGMVWIRDPRWALVQLEKEGLADDKLRNFVRRNYK